MNYNIFLGEIQFIDTKGDTLSLANPETIDSVAIDTSLIYYKKGYLQVIAAYGSYKLVKREKLNFGRSKLAPTAIIRPAILLRVREKLLLCLM